MNTPTISRRQLPCALFAAGLMLPGVAIAHSGPPAILVYFILGVAPLLLFLLIFLIYLPFSRFSGAQRMRMLGLFLLLAAVSGAVTYFLPDYTGYAHSYLMWLLPLIVVPLYARKLPRR